MLIYEIFLINKNLFKDILLNKHLFIIRDLKHLFEYPYSWDSHICLSSLLESRQIISRHFFEKNYIKTLVHVTMSMNE